MSQTPSKVFPGADERSPSRSQYFSWINNTNEGATEAQTLANLEFFGWLNREYGMVLDIYAFDAGAIDGAKFYGKTSSERFRRQFPSGFGSVAQRAAKMGTRLGVWGGPDGFGETEADAEARIEMMVSLCRDHQFELFKMDAVCGQLRADKRPYFVRMMEECRKHSPDLILLNHRLELGEGIAHATTFLFEGAETYIDVHMANQTTGRHNRVCALERGLPPNLTRLTEDHGVCLSSCLDFWEDDLILQAFNRCLILAPELYGSPWLLRDDEFPRLARIFNLHRRYRDLLVDGVVLPEAEFGPSAVSRGNGKTQLLTLRNLRWAPVSYTIPLSGLVGLQPTEGSIHARRLHPYERVLGEFAYGDSFEIEVPPFRSLLLLLTSEAWESDPVVLGADYEVIRDVPGKNLELRLLAPGGSTQAVTLPDGSVTTVTFPGEALTKPAFRVVTELSEAPVPADARSLIEATYFAADNNALEYREWIRSGPTAIPEVAVARNAFFDQPLFRERFAVDRALFSDDPAGGFATSRRWGDVRVAGGAFRLDFGEVIELDQLTLEVQSEYELQPLKLQENVRGFLSEDLQTWHEVFFWASPSLVTTLPEGFKARYVVLDGCPDLVRSVRGSLRGKPLDRTQWRASNLFPSPGLVDATQAFEGSFRLDECAPGSELCVAVEGVHGVEGATAALRIGGKWVGAPRRAPSFPSNTWECPVRTTDRNTTYFFPVDPAWVGQTIEVVVLALGYRRWAWDGLKKEPVSLKPVVYLCGEDLVEVRWSGPR